MISYMTSESLQVRTCINGTLYSLLKRKKIKNEARTLGLEKKLKVQLQNPNDQMKKQIQYILDELNSETEQEEKGDEEFEDENYGDEEENADDDYVFIIINNTTQYEEDSIAGDILVLHYQYLGYYIFKTAHENQIETQKILDYLQGDVSNVNRNMISNSSSIRKDEIIDKPLRRPTTPMTVISSTSNSQIFNPGILEFLIYQKKNQLRQNQIQGK